MKMKGEKNQLNHCIMLVEDKDETKEVLEE
jgi:hypothetical protein